MEQVVDKEDRSSLLHLEEEDGVDRFGPMQRRSQHKEARLKDIEWKQTKVD